MRGLKMLVIILRVTDLEKLYQVTIRKITDFILMKHQLITQLIRREQEQQKLMGNFEVQSS